MYLPFNYIYFALCVSYAGTTLCTELAKCNNYNYFPSKNPLRLRCCGSRGDRII